VRNGPGCRKGVRAHVGEHFFLISTTNCGGMPA
jgi:hypothetical protein